MNNVLVMLVSMLVPAGAMGLLLWLTHLEEQLPRDVRAARRKPEPAPILAIAVRVPRPQQVPEVQEVQEVLVTLPAQRMPEPAVAQAFSRSGTPVSLGGSTKR